MKIIKKIYAEIGYENETFLNTEIEIWENGKEKSETRIKKFILPKKIDKIYFRFWIGKKNYILSFKGFEVKNKNRNKIKFLFGIAGEEYNKK